MNEPRGHCTPDTRLQDVAQMMIECDCGAIPVIESEQNPKLLGIVTDRDIVIRLLARGENPLEKTAQQCMSTPVHTVTPETDEEELCHVMERHQIRRVPVVDEQGICCGIISQADIARRASEHETAEVVRDISQPVGAAG